MIKTIELDLSGVEISIKNDGELVRILFEEKALLSLTPCDMYRFIKVLEVVND